LALAYAMAKVLRVDVPNHAITAAGKPAAWWEVLRYRNVIFNTLGMFCWLSCLIVLSAFMPNYLTDYLQLSMDQMSLVLTGLGIGSFSGMLLMPALSDRLGRKLVILVSLAIEIVALCLLVRTGADPISLFAILFVATFMNAGVVAITVGPLTSDSVPRHLASSATGIVVGLGEVVGGAVAPAIAGVVAQNFGMVNIPYLALGAIVLGFIVAAIGVKEPKPLFVIKGEQFTSP
jgi:predicted MFS family arabinose efflux permease